MSIINIKNLTKDYGNNKGIFDLNLSIEKGEVFGFLGPNGAGKTTTIRNLLGFLNPDKGECTIQGLNCRKNASTIQKDLGYLPGEINFFDDMKGIEFLKFMANLRKMKDFTKMNRLVEFFELDIKCKIKKMSKGMKQKLGIVCAFMHNPSILILDEPTSGLDPLMQNKFISLILEEKKQSKTILMSSHSFEEIERTCNRVGIIKQGRFVAVETIQTLKENGRKMYSIGFKNIDDIEKFSKENIDIVSIQDNNVYIGINNNLNNVIKILSNYEIISLNEIDQDLEEVFIGYYGGNKNV